MVSLSVIIITVVRIVIPLPSKAGCRNHVTLFSPEIPRSVIYKGIYTLRFTELDTFQSKKNWKTFTINWHFRSVVKIGSKQRKTTLIVKSLFWCYFLRDVCCHFRRINCNKEWQVINCCFFPNSVLKLLLDIPKTEFFLHFSINSPICFKITALMQKFCSLYLKERFCE